MKHASLTLKYLSVLAIVAAMGSSVAHAALARPALLGKLATRQAGLAARNVATRMAPRQFCTQTNKDSGSEDQNQFTNWHDFVMANTTPQFAARFEQIYQQQEIESLKKLIEEKNRKIETLQREGNILTITAYGCVLVIVGWAGYDILKSYKIINN